MKKTDIARRLLVAFLTLAMIVTYTPTSFAASITDQDPVQTESTAETLKEDTAVSEENAIEEASPQEKATDANAGSVAFVRESQIDDAIVKVEAEPGVFPEDAQLIAEKADKTDEAKATEAIDEVRSDKLNVADSYTFDIRVVDADGNELQPAEDQKVNVTFNMARAADPNLSADIYHLTEAEVSDPKATNKEDEEPETVLVAEKLDAVADPEEAAVTAQTDGFSLYTVEFTYGELQYVMEGGSEVKASVITKAVGLEGEIEDIRVSNEELFSASRESGEWIVKSHKPFKTDEWMRVTIDGAVYEIIVTDAEGDIEVRTWSEMQAAINNIADGKTILVREELTAGSGDERFAVVRGSAGSSFTIDLAGHTINRNLSSKNDNNKGHVFDVNKGNITIIDSVGGGKLTGGSDENGGAIVIGGEGTLNIEGVTISGNRAKKEGGAIYVYGKLNMTGGRISDNTSDTGGAISVHKSGTVTLNNVDIQNNTASSDGGGIAVKGMLTMTGGTVSGNKAEDAAGVYNRGGTIKLTDVTISGNETSKYGGAGINNKGKATIEGCQITGNKAKQTGGGIYADSDITITNCTFTNNHSDTCGGAVRMYDCKATITDCVMTGNTANEYGGAVYIDDDGKAVISGVNITGGTAYKGGSGIYVGSKGKLDLGGVNNITGNTATDVYMTSGRKINITSALGNEAKKSQIGVVLKDQEGVITSGYSQYNGDTDPYEYIIPEVGCSVALEKGEVQYLASRWGFIQHLIDAAENGDVINLDWDIKAKEDDKSLTVPAGKVITINLNGHTLDRGLSSHKEGGEVFTVNGNLTIKDNAGGGKVKGGYGTGGGVLVNNGGSFILEGGSITKNKAETNGGGILVLEGASATIKTTGSDEAPIVEGNSAPKGAGIYSAGTLEIQKDTVIKDNDASESGGGLYIAGGSVELSGTIKENSATNEAGGIWHGTNATLNVKGAPDVTGNTSAVANNIYLKDGKVITVKSLTDGSGKEAKLDVTANAGGVVLTSGLTESGAEDKAAQVFTYNGAAFDGTLEIKEDGELHNKEVTADVWVSDWQALQNAINSSQPGQVIGLEGDVTAGGGDKCQFVEDGRNVIIELNGHVINRNLNDDKGNGNVFRIQDGSTLTIRDGVGTGVLTGGYPDGDGGAINIEDDSTFVLEGGTIKGNRSTRDGGAIYIDEGFLKMTGGTIADNKAGDEGGAIYCRDDGYFEISNAVISSNKSEGGGGAIKAHLDRDSSIKDSVIRDNRSDSTGGAVNLDQDKKTLAIENTIIKGNKAEEDAGGIYLQNGTIRMNGGELSDNSGKDAGGIMVTSDEKFFAEGVAITSNESRKESGGGVNNQGNTTLTGCTINKNEADKAGGGVYNKSKLSMTDCTLSENTSEEKGGAVFNKDDAALKNCTITKNKSNTEVGGGVCHSDNKMSIDGGRITENEGRSGNGIYVDDELSIQGALVVKDNEYQNVYLNDEKLKVTGSLEGSDIRVTMSKETGTFTKGYKNNNKDPESGAEIEPWYYFAADDESYSVLKDNDGEAKIAGSEWPQLQKLIDDTANSAEEGGETPILVLDRSWQAKKSDAALTIPAGKSIVIDLNGFTIDRNRESKSGSGQVFVVNSGNALTIRDSSEAKTGTITGGWAENGGAIHLNAPSNDGPAPILTIESGNITGNKADRGGAIYMAETGSQTNGATVNLTGGIISGNQANVEAGGIWVGKTGNLNVSGMPFVLGNNGGAGSNILLGEGNQLHITGELTVGSGNTGDTIDTAALDLTAKSAEGAEGTGVKLTEGLTDTTPEGSTPEDYAKAIFTYNETSYESTLEIKEGELYSKDVYADIWISDWAELQAAVDNRDNEGGIIGLKRDIDASRDNYSIKVDGDKIGNVTIELNGHKMDRKRSSSNDDGHVINVKDGATLTIRDGVGTGILTGGNSSDDGGGIKIEKNSKCVIEGGTISGNKADPDGGGIFVKGTLVMTGGTISNNYADDTGGGIYCSDSGTFDLKNARIYGNTSDNDGGGLIVHLKSEASIENCSILNNESKTEDGGAMRVEADEKTLTIKDSLIGANRAENDGGGIVIYAGKVVMNGGAISNNTSEDGAGVYNDDGTIEFDSVIIDSNTSTKKGGAGINNRNNATLTNCVITNNTGNASGGGIYTNEPITVTGGRVSGNSATGDGGGIFNTDDGTRLTGVEISGNSAKKDGGGIFTDEDMTLTNCTLDSNKSDVDGGGMRIKDCSVSLENCTIKDNDASEEGGGIYINNDDAELKLNGGTFTGNAARSGGGIYVNDGTDDVFIKGDIGIYDNIAYGDVYLAKGRKLTVTGPLAEGEGSTASSRIGIVTKDGFEKNFTKDYNKHNPGIDPATVFFSNENHIVYLKDGKEAALKKNNAVVDENPFIEVNSQMERRIGALNGANWMSGLSGERYLSEVNMPGTHDSGMNNVQGNVRTSRGSWISAGVFGGIGIVVGGIFGALMGGPAGFAIGALIVGTIAAGSGLSAGVDVMTGFARTQDRYIDEQLEDGIRKFDLRVNTCYVDLGFAKKDNGKDLWIIHGEDKMGGTFYALDDDDDRLTLAMVFEWYKKFLREHPTETILIGIDPQGIGLDKDEADERIEKHIRSLAQEINPSTGKPYLYTENGDYTNIKYTTWPQVKDCRGQVIYSLGKKTGLAAEYQVGGSYKDDANAKKKHLKEFYEQYGFDPLPTTGYNGNKYFDYYMSAGTNGTQQPTHTPLWVADQVLPTLFDKGGLLTDRQGKYIGLVNMDRETSKVSRQVWITNFFSGLEYCTVTAKESGDDDNPKTYTVLSETPIVIPDCIYPDPNSADERFWYWKATDSDGNLVGNYYPGDPFTVMEDVTFTAVWEEPDLSSIRAVWVDGDDADGIRPKKLNVTVTKAKEEGEEGDPETEIITLTEGNKVWRKDLNYSAKSVAVEEVPEGYTCNITDTRITLYHTPEKSIHAAGTITWRDNDDSGGQRPSEVTLNLYEDGVQTKEIRVKADDNWTYDLGKLPLYKYDEEKNKVTKINYSLTETGVPDEYSTDVSGLIEKGSNQGFEITNTLTSSEEMLLGYIYWSDEENDGATRPDKVTLNLYANGEKVTSQDIGAGSATTWLFDFIKDPAIPYSDYEITVDPIPGYNTTVNMGTEYTGAIIVATLESHKHEEQEATVVITEATCDEPGEQVTTRYCTTCGAVFDVKTEEIEPLGHEWGKWNTKKTATEDEEGLEERVCSRDSDHVESRVVPKKTHVHKSVKVNAKAPTCTVDGNVAYYYCSECGWYYRDESKPAETWFEHGDEVLPALGHDWDDWKVVKEATDTEAGTEQRVCRHDATHKETRDIPPVGHEHQLSNVDAKEPTCTEDGNIEYWVCNRGENPCGLYFGDSAARKRINQSDTVIPATGHDWSEWETVTPASETEEGLERRTCTKEGCGAAEERNIPKTTHVHKPVFVPGITPTCTTPGNMAYYCCEECGWYFLSPAHPGTTWIAPEDVVLPIDPDAHDWSPWKETKAPTDKEEGEEEHTCNRCGKVESRAVPKVDPSTVSYRVTEGNEQIWYKGSSDTADFIFKRSVDDKSTFSHFTGIRVDGEKVASKHYTAESGSVIIKLKPECLNKLKNGKHEITAEFDDGAAAATFRVAVNGGSEKGNGTGNGNGTENGNGNVDSNVNGSGKGAGTGDDADLTLWLMLMLAAMTGMSAYAINRRRSRG